MNRLRFLILAGLASAVGCSVLNSFDAVKPARGTGGTGGVGGSAGIDGSSGASGSAGAGAGGGGGGSAGVSSGGSGGSTGPGGASGSGGAGGSGGNAGTDGAAGDAGLLHGAVVVAGEAPVDGGKTAVLTVLDPTSGAELSWETEPHDIAALTQDAGGIWFIFIRGRNAFADSTLSVRRLGAGGVWTTLSSGTTVPTPFSQSDLAVLNGRILYKSQVPNEAGTTLTVGYTLLSTSTSGSVQVLTRQTSLSLPASTMTGWPNSLSPGGTVTMISDRDLCGADAGAQVGTCNVQLGTVLVDNTTTLSVRNANTKTVGAIPQNDGLLGVATDRNAGYNVLVLPTSVNSATVQEFTYTANQQQGSPVPFNPSQAHISDAAFDDCDEIAFASVLDSTGVSNQLLAIPIVGGDPQIARAPSSTSVQRIAYEPYTHSVIVPFSDESNPALNAFLVGGSATAPTLTQRTKNTTLKWDPPATLNPQIVTAARPDASFTCPTL